ncbi:hypothetical protein BC826DRAFT_1042774 [Russula brevipes]|nr:hypothetical protein BC826DRAFT_1042774 [Russula brevipes]
MECYSSRVFSDLRQIHPRMNQECLPLDPNSIVSNPIVPVKKDPAAPTPEMIPPGNTRLIPMLNSVFRGEKFHVHGHYCALMQQ